MNNKSLQASVALSEEETEKLRKYLKEHPDFFEHNADLLEDISLPHDSGKAVSLIERQVTVLRQRNMEMRQQISNMIDAAKSNDKLFDKTKRLVLGLLEATDLTSLVETLQDSLRNDYQLEFFSLILIGEQATDIPVKTVTAKQAQQGIGPLLNGNRAICGILRKEEMHFLFGDQAAAVASVAAMPLSHGNTLGVLAIGSRDPHYYSSSMGTLFLSYIADVLNRLLPRFLSV